MAVAASGIATPALALPSLGLPRHLGFHNLHTDEKLNVTYWREGRYDPAALQAIHHILRDHYSGDQHPIDIRLIDLVHDMQAELQTDRRVEIISGYRSPHTNLHLASLSSGVASKSYHMKGMAIDLRIDGVALSKIHTTALAMRRGGVGYYPDSQFVHVDVGPRRFW